MPSMRSDQLANRKGLAKSYFALERIASRLEDLEVHADRYIAEARLEKRQPAIKSAYVRKALRISR